MKLKSLVTLLLVAFSATGQAQTAGPAPDVMVKNVTNEVLQIIHSDKDIQAGNEKKTIELIEAKVLPHFDFTHMTQLAVGRNWKSANTTQQKQLIDEFHILLVRTYSKALTEFKAQTIEFKPFKMKVGDAQVKVRTQVSQQAGKSVPLDYYLEKLPAGWQVYDIEVDGISLVIVYREAFAAEVASGGVDGLIKSLREKNRGKVS